MILYSLTNLAIGSYDFSLVASFSLDGSFQANQRICLNVNHFCSFDNWLCDLILVAYTATHIVHKNIIQVVELSITEQ